MRRKLTRESMVPADNQSIKGALGDQSGTVMKN